MRLNKHTKIFKRLDKAFKERKEWIIYFSTTYVSVESDVIESNGILTELILDEKTGIIYHDYQGSINIIFDKEWDILFQAIKEYNLTILGMDKEKEKNQNDFYYANEIKAQIERFEKGVKNE